MQHHLNGYVFFCTLFPVAHELFGYVHVLLYSFVSHSCASPVCSLHACSLVSYIISRKSGHSQSLLAMLHLTIQYYNNSV